MKPGHTKYLVTCDSDNCMDVFKDEKRQLPRCGSKANGKIVIHMDAQRLREGFYLVSVVTEDVAA